MYKRQTQDNGNKKGDFKNKYLLDGEIDPESPDPKPEPNPNPIPTPDPDKPDPITPIPGPDGQDPDAAELAKFKIMKQVRGPLASHDQNFDVTVTLTSEKPVRSDISYTGGSIKKVGEGSGWKMCIRDRICTLLCVKLKNPEKIILCEVDHERITFVKEHYPNRCV